MAFCAKPNLQGTRSRSPNPDLQVTLTESVEKNDKLRLPAVTVCAIPGLTKRKSVRAGAYKKECQNVTTAQGFSSCFKNSFNDLVVSASRGVYGTENKKDLSDFNLWTWDMTFPIAGRCYTLDYDVPVGINQKKDILAIRLNSSHEYFVVVHETSLFALTTNRLAATTYFWLSQSTKNKRITQVTLEAVKWKRMNLPERPCNPSPDYNFTECVIESKAKAVGCTLPWNKQIPGM